MKKQLSKALGSIFTIFLLLNLTSCAATDQTKNATINESQVSQCATWNINYQQATSFAKEIQKAIKNNDKKTFANFIHYPLVIYSRSENTAISKKIIIKNKVDLLNQYSTLFNEKFQVAILNANPNDIFCNYQGAMIANGAIWFGNAPLQIFTVNTP